MNAILSNFRIENSKTFSDLYFKGDFQETDSYIFYFDGFVTNQEDRSLFDIIEKIVRSKGEFLKQLRGQFFSIVIEKKTKKIIFFNDKYGIKDLFLYCKNDKVAISNNFMSIVKNIELDIQDIDRHAIAQFLVFEYPILDKTFFKSVEYLPLSAYYEFNNENKEIVRSKYWEYLFEIDDAFDIDTGIMTIDRCINNFFLEIKKLINSNCIFGLGLSGGIDSRVVAYYAKKYGLQLKTFIFGEKKSDAYYISNKIASLLELEHFELGHNPNFFLNSKHSISFNPMMNLLYTWYYSVVDKLPQFDFLLTGFNGDNQFGVHIDRSEIYFETENQLVDAIISKYDELNYLESIEHYLIDSSLKSAIKNDILSFVSKSKNKEYWQIKEEFNYKFRQRKFIKEIPSFNFLGKYKSFSPFTDSRFLDFMMTVPVDSRINLRLCYDFVKTKLPDLAKIRPERNISIMIENKTRKSIEKWIRRLDQKLHINLRYKKEHKNVWEWLKKNDEFMKYVGRIFEFDNSYFYTIFNRESINYLLNNLKFNKYQCFLLFRIMTIKLFLDSLIDQTSFSNNIKIDKKW